MNKSLYYLYLGFSKLKDSRNSNLNIMDAQKEIISRLKFLGKVKRGEKINIRGMYVQADGFMTSLSRSFLHPDNRENTKVFVLNTVRQSLELLGTTIGSEKPSDKIMGARIIKDLMFARDNGLKNLKYTYSEDSMFCCEMDTILEGVDGTLSEVLDKYPDILNYEEEKASPSLSKLSAPPTPPQLSLDAKNEGTVDDSKMDNED